MSERLREVFATGRESGRALFVAYVTAGYPTREDTVPILKALAEGGTDVIEVGIPFSDAMADGATIQHANEVALRAGITFAECLRFVRQARSEGLAVPIVLMGYYNPVLAFGEERAVAEAKSAGADGFIVVDLPPDEGSTFVTACKSHDLSVVPLIAPTTRDDRIRTLAQVADAFVYCVSVLGTTGGKAVAPAELPRFLSRVRRQTSLPIAVGFGISTREHVREVARLADAAVIGSAIIGAIDAAGPDQRAARVREFVEDVTGRRRAENEDQRPSPGD